MFFIIFCSKTLNAVFTAKYNVSCQSHNIVYCLTCQTCGLQCVSMTKRKFQERLREHLRNIRSANLGDPIGKHFDLTGHHNDPNNVESHILSFITRPGNSSGALSMRLKFELQWIYRLRTSLPHGLNSCRLTPMGSQHATTLVCPSSPQSYQTGYSFSNISHFLARP